MKELKSEKTITFQEAFDLLMNIKVSYEEFHLYTSELHKIKDKLEVLYAYTHGHLEGNPAFRNTVIVKDKDGCPDKIFTKQEIEGKSIVFEALGDL